MAELLTDVELAEIEAKYAATVQGEWKTDVNYIYAEDEGCLCADFDWHNKGEENMEFIALIHNVTPRLIAHIRALAEYASLLERGMSTHEARETVWPDEATIAAPVRYVYSNFGKLRPAEPETCECAENGRKCRCDVRDEDF